ncbi:hypothetical protein V6Z12_D10G147300, partial [Gossypium hirsutum]
EVVKLVAFFVSAANVAILYRVVFFHKSVFYFILAPSPKFPIQIPNQSIFTETCFGSSIFVSSILQLVFLLKKKIFVSVSCKLSYEDREDEEGGRTFQFCFLVKQYLRVFDPFTSGNRSEMLLFLFIVGKINVFIHSEDRIYIENPLSRYTPVDFVK